VSQPGQAPYNKQMSLRFRRGDVKLKLVRCDFLSGLRAK
jgi:hypothetical protein